MIYFDGLVVVCFVLEVDIVVVVECFGMEWLLYDVVCCKCVVIFVLKYDYCLMELLWCI